MGQDADFREIARRACVWTRESAARFVRSQFPRVSGGVLKGSLDDFRKARNDLAVCRHCSLPSSCPLNGTPMRLFCEDEGGEKVIRARRSVCRRWSETRSKPRSEERRDLA